MDKNKFDHSTERMDEMLESSHKGISPWRVFKIMSEFVSGFEFISQYDYKKAVTFFGSARYKSDNTNYKEAKKLASALARKKYVVITGGGPGIMEAANRGAHEAKGISVGINIKNISGGFEDANPFIHRTESFNYFFTRKVMLAFASQIYIFFPGGYGTLDELFEMLVLVQKEKIKRTPIILVNKKFWSPLKKWIDEFLFTENLITAKDKEIYKIVDSAEEAMKVVSKKI